VHAAVSSGVMVSDLADNYWSKRFIGAGRISNIAADTTAFTSKP
jgi:hypothetical protein